METLLHMAKEFILQWLMTDQGTTIILNWLVGVGALVGAFVASRWVGESKSRGKALGYAERAAADVFHRLVKEWKAARADGKLTADEARQARDAAFDEAISIAKRDGFDLIKEVGYEEIPRLIEAAVNRLKRRADPGV